VSIPPSRTPTGGGTPRRRRLGLLAFAASLVLILLLTGFGYAALRANYEQNQEESIANVEKTARLAGALGGSLITLAQQELRVLGKSAPFLASDPAGIQQAIDLTNPLSIGFAGGMAWLDATRQVRARWINPLDPVELDFAATAAVRQAFDSKAPAVESLVDEASSDIRPIVIAVPLLTLGGDVTGVLTAAVQLRSSDRDFVRQLFGTDAILVVDPAGRQVIGTEEADESSLAVARDVQARIVDADRRDEGTPNFLTPDNGVFADVSGSVVGYARVQDADWLIVVDRPRDQLFAPLRWQFERSLLALGLLFLMSVAGAAFASWRLDRVHRRETESRRLFQTVLEQLPVGVVALDRGGKVVITNERADLVLGDRPDPGEPAPESLRAAVDAVRSGITVRNDEVRVGDWTPTGPGGRTLVVRAAPVETGGQITGSAAIVEDVTDQREREQRARRLASATAGLAMATSRQEVAAVVADAVRAFGAQAAMVVLRDDLRPDQLVLASTSGFGAGATDGWETVRLDSSTPVAEATRTGREVFVTLDDAPARFPDMGDMFERSGNGAWAAIPLRSAGRIDGALGMSFRHADDVNDATRLQLAGFAAQVSQALDRASRQSIEHDVALVLQRGLLQPVEGDLDVHVEVASRYAPAEDHLEVGGDFFDVLPLADGSVMVVIGDVVGHGIDAASAMGQLRSAVRALSATTSSPARLLELLDHFAGVVPACRFATAAIVVVDADRTTLRYSLAGHPPPAWHDRSGAAGLLREALSRPLGVYPDRRPEATVDVDGGVTVCLYTDGLIEKRTEVIDEGLERLVDTMSRHHTAPCEALVDVLLEEVGGSGRQRDDIAVVCARFTR